MDGFYFTLFVIGLIAMLSCVAWKPERIFEFPYFIAGVFTVFILPQAYSLMKFPGTVSSVEVENVLLMTCLCFFACIAGYQFKPSARILSHLARPMDPRKMMHVGAALILIGSAAMYALPKNEVQIAQRGGLTGIATIYLFFGGLVFPGFAITILLLRQHFTVGRLIAVIIGSIVPLLSIYNGRREAAVVFGLTLLLTRFFAARKTPPRLLIFGALIFAMLAIPATGTYRGLVATGQVSKIDRIDLYENFVNYFNKESTLELRNGAALIKATTLLGSYQWGTGYWNQLVFRFVPAQILGRDFKDALMSGSTVQKLYSSRLATQYEIPPGSTLTGMGDSFQEFGWFGFIFFIFLAFIFRSVWAAASQPNAIFPQLFYILICSSAMRTVTHQTVDFLPGMIYQLTFLSVGYLYAKAPYTHVHQVRQPRPLMRSRRG